MVNDQSSIINHQSSIILKNNNINKRIRTGDKIRLYHPTTRSFITSNEVRFPLASSSPRRSSSSFSSSPASRCTVSASPDALLHSPNLAADGEALNLTSTELSSNLIFCLEQERPDRGGALKWNGRVRLCHLNTGCYLSVRESRTNERGNRKGEASSEVNELITIDNRNENDFQRTLFSFSPLSKHQVKGDGSIQRGLSLAFKLCAAGGGERRRLARQTRGNEREKRGRGRGRGRKI